MLNIITNYNEKLTLYDHSNGINGKLKKTNIKY